MQINLTLEAAILWLPSTASSSLNAGYERHQFAKPSLSGKIQIFSRRQRNIKSSLYMAKLLPQDTEAVK